MKLPKRIIHNHYHSIISLIAFVWVAFFALVSFDGYYFYDDYAYSLYAYQLSVGTYELSTPQIFAHRLGFILPLALLYKVLGVSDATTVALPLASTLCSVFLLIQLSRSFPARTQLYVLALGLTNFYFLFFANKLYPDVLLTTQVLAIVFILKKRNQQNILYAIIFAFFNIWAFLTKELIIFLFPFYLYLFFKDILSKQNVIFWVVSIAGALLAGLVYLFVYKNLTGDAWFRFTLIQSEHYTASYSYFDKPFVHTLRRLTYEPFIMFINTGLMITMGGVWWISEKRSSFYYFFFLAFVSILVAFWFFSTSWQYYNPIGLFPRHILMLIPLSALLTGWQMGSVHTSLQTRWIVLVWVLSAWVAYFTVGWKYVILYGALATGLGLAMYVPLVKRFFLIVFFALLLLHPIYHLAKPTETGYQDEKFIFENYVHHINKPSIIYTDDKLLNGYLWYSQFQENEFIEFKYFDKLSESEKTNKTAYLLINRHSVAYFQEIGIDVSEWIDDAEQNWQKVAQKGAVSLYKLQK